MKNIWKLSITANVWVWNWWNWKKPQKNGILLQLLKISYQVILRTPQHKQALFPHLTNRPDLCSRECRLHIFFSSTYVLLWQHLPFLPLQIKLAEKFTIKVIITTVFNLIVNLTIARLMHYRQHAILFATQYTERKYQLMQERCHF